MRYFEELFYALMYFSLTFFIAYVIHDASKLMHWSVIP